MSRVYTRCPQCDGKECADISCKFSGIKHEDATTRPADALRLVEENMGDEAAWTTVWTGVPAA